MAKQYCADQTHRLSGPTDVRPHFGPPGLLRRGERFFIAIDEAEMVSGNHLKQLVDGLWQAAKVPDPLLRFNRITWVLLGDPERQSLNISGPSEEPGVLQPRVWIPSKGRLFLRSAAPPLLVDLPSVWRK